MSRRGHVIAWAFVVALSSAHASAADGQPTNSTELAQQRFHDALQAVREGRYSAAASLFEAADRLAPHASTRYNAATAWEAAGELARAATGFEAALALGALDETRRELAEQRLAALRASLGRISIQKPLGAFVTVDHMQRAPVPTVFYLRPGSYDFIVEYRGERSNLRADIAAGSERELDLGLPDPRDASTVAAPPPPEVPPPITQKPDLDTGAARKTWGWIGVGAGVALGGAAIVLGLNALNARDRYFASGRTDVTQYDRASNLRLATNVLWGGSAAAGITGIVLLLSTPTIEF